jgi:hypothetical protein
MLAGGAISWSSALQPLVSLSSTEAEYIALTDAAKEAIWLRTFFEEIHRLLQGPLSLLGDNQGSLALGKNPEFHKRTKHIKRRYHFVQEAVDSGDIELGFVPTQQMVADVLTKALTRELHAMHRSSLGVLPMPL